MQEKLTTKNQSVQKMFQIIEVMADNRGPMRLQDISKQVQIPASTVLRMLNSLMYSQYVLQDPESQRYYLSMKFCRIGECVKSQFSIRDIVRPYLTELSEKCQESACLAIEQEMSVVYIDTVEGPDKMLKTLQRIGKFAPLHCTGVGKLLLLNYDSEKLKTFVVQKGLQNYTQNTITTFEELVSELEKIKKQDYALDDEECETGARCVAAPLRDYTGKIVACISVSGPTSRINGKKTEEIKAVISSVAKEVSKILGQKTDI